MTDWLLYLKQLANSDVWGLIALDMYYKARAEGQAHTPVGFLKHIGRELAPLAGDHVAFQRVLLAAGIQLLGDDFDSIVEIAQESSAAAPRDLTPEDVLAIAESYEIYGQGQLFRQRFISSEHGPELQKPESEGSMPSDELSYRRTVQVIDLVGYSDVIRALEENLDSRAVATINEQIQEFITGGLRDVGVDRAESLMKTTGDGAILHFDSAEAAHAVGVAVHKRSASHNAARTERSAKRHFRIGMATGEITRQSLPDGSVEYAGITISNAVRLESQARPGEIVIDKDSYAALPQTIKLSYGEEEPVKGKRDEVFIARRCIVVPQPEMPPAVSKDRPKPSPSSDRRQTLDRLQRLEPDGIDELIFLLNIPFRDRPASTLSSHQRCNHVLGWADQQGRLSELDSELQFILTPKAR